MARKQKIILRKFTILGLHGYKDIELDFHGPARIVIAENGTGKTTLLSALSAFLQADFDKLRNISFNTIECVFGGADKPLVLKHEQLPQPSSDITTAISELAGYSGTDPAELRRVIIETDPQQVMAGPRWHPLFRHIYINSPLSQEDVILQVRTIRSMLDQARTDDLKALAQAINAAVGPYQLLYLPTYRRVELPLAKEQPRGAREPRGFRPGRRGSLLERYARMGIQFGLADVDERLNELLGEIQAQSNMGYRRISANIIDELLMARDAATDTAQLPNVESLARFFSRIEQSSAPGERLKSIQELYATGEISSADNSTLRYFLTKLSRVVEQTRELEASIEQFVEKANTYLSSSSEEKTLRYDASGLKVLAQSLWTGAEIKLDDLSSGEKQVVSLLAHFYLHPRKKIVLIDEPELSLSIDWQKRLLPDVLASPTCAQLLAITHSPFIFDNELDPFAGPVLVRRTKGNSK